MPVCLVLLMTLLWQSQGAQMPWFRWQSRLIKIELSHSTTCNRDLLISPEHGISSRRIHLVISSMNEYDIASPKLEKSNNTLKLDVFMYLHCRKRKAAYAPDVTFMKSVIFSPITVLLVSVMHFTMADYCFASQFIMLLTLLYLIYNICLA